MGPKNHSNHNGSQSYLPIYNHLLIDISACTAVSTQDLCTNPDLSPPPCILLSIPHLCEVEAPSSQLPWPCSRANTRNHASSLLPFPVSSPCISHSVSLPPSPGLIQSLLGWVPLTARCAC